MIKQKKIRKIGGGGVVRVGDEKRKKQGSRTCRR